MAWNRPRFDSFFASLPDSRGRLDPYGEEISAAPFEQFLQPTPVPWPSLPSHLSWGALPPPDVPRLSPYVPGYVPLPALSFGPDFDESRQPSDQDQRAIRTLPYDLRLGRGGPSTFPYFPDGAAPEPFDLGPLSQPGPWFSPYFYDPRVPMLDRAPDAPPPLIQPLAYSAMAGSSRGGVTIPLPPQTWPIPPEMPTLPDETPAWATLYPSGGVLDPTHQATYDPWEQTMPDHAGFGVWSNLNSQREQTLDRSSDDGHDTRSNPNSEWQQPLDGSELASREKREPSPYEERFKGLDPVVREWVNRDPSSSREGKLSDEEMAAVAYLSRLLNVDAKRVARLDPAPASLLATIIGYRQLDPDARGDIDARILSMQKKILESGGDPQDIETALRLADKPKQTMAEFLSGDPKTFADAEIERRLNETKKYDDYLKAIDWRDPFDLSQFMSKVDIIRLLWAGLAKSGRLPFEMEQERRRALNDLPNR